MTVDIKVYWVSELLQFSFIEASSMNPIQSIQHDWKGDKHGALDKEMAQQLSRLISHRHSSSFSDCFSSISGKVSDNNVKK